MLFSALPEAQGLPCDLALPAIGFEGVEHMTLLDGLDLELNRRGGAGLRAGLADHRSRGVRVR